jgi:hypothetical protein
MNVSTQLDNNGITCSNLHQLLLYLLIKGIALLNHSNSLYLSIKASNCFILRLSASLSFFSSSSLSLSALSFSSFAFLSSSFCLFKAESRESIDGNSIAFSQKLSTSNAKSFSSLSSPNKSFAPALFLSAKYFCKYQTGSTQSGQPFKASITSSSVQIALIILLKL